MYLLSKELKLSTTKIATEVGVKDHTTVMHGIKKIEQDLRLNFVLRDQITEINTKNQNQDESIQDLLNYINVNTES